MSSSFDLPSVDRITVGTVGEPGNRTFYLQAREDSLVVSLKVEKGQVAALAQRIGELAGFSRSSSPSRCASAATWPFSTLRLTTSESSRACRKNVRLPGSPTVPTVMRSTDGRSKLLTLPREGRRWS